MFINLNLLSKKKKLNQICPVKAGFTLIQFTAGLHPLYDAVLY